MMAIEVYIPTHNVLLEQAMHFLHILTLIMLWTIAILTAIRQWFIVVSFRFIFSFNYVPM